jgi:phosphatidylserine/phosphatidylglycerophosphate/cardiolipin synthase-like enzyme
VRISQADDKLRIKAIAGTHVVLMAFDMDEDTRQGLRGFAIKRGLKGQPQDWLRGIKYFKELVPNPDPHADYPSREQPFQTFLWSDYRADPATEYDFTVVALYGDLHNLEERHELSFSVKTEPENDGKHGVWFNRGAIASHAFETHFHNKALTDEMTNAVSDDGKLLDDETRWLSRGLAEACLKYINSTGHGEGLRVCAYEFTYQPILNALKRAHARGVDVQIIYHDTKKDNDANRAAIAQAGLPSDILTPRTRVAIPHNKFIVKLSGSTPTQVWTGSTNFTDTGMFGQTNVGHQVTDAATAKTYFDYWTELKQDPTHKNALNNAVALTPNPKNVLPKSSISAFYSPREADNMLDWYAQRIGDSCGLAMMTIPFNVAKTILGGLTKTSAALRLVILEDVPTKEVLDGEKRNRGKLIFSNGAILGKTFIKLKTSFGGAKVAPIPNSDLDKWFVDEELARPANKGHVFFIHSKVLIVDPLSDDPLVCSGSANFSTNSLTANDENMLLIRGETRVADIYMTEMDRLFRHFYARDVINSKAAAGDQHNPLELDPTDGWIAPNFEEGRYKNNRRLLFFPAGGPVKTWFEAAQQDPDPFADEDARAAAARAKKSKKKTDAAPPETDGAEEPAATAGATSNKTSKTAKTATKKRKKAVKKAAKKSAKKKHSAKKTARKSKAKKSKTKKSKAKKSKTKKSKTKKKAKKKG